jgi:GGDEF domain-containing protein
MEDLMFEDLMFEDLMFEDLMFEDLMFENPMMEDRTLGDSPKEDPLMEELMFANPEPERSSDTDGNPGTEDNTHGGVANLVRTAKRQCGADIAFVALRDSDGTFTTVVAPAQTFDPKWTGTAIEELASRIWQDPELAGIRVLVRKGRAYRTAHSGFNRSARVAVAPLGGVTGDEAVSGLLCVGDPAQGRFEQAQLDLLESIALRITSYLRARREVIGTRGSGEPVIVVSTEGAAPGPELESEDPPVALAEADELPSDDRPIQVESELDEVGEAPGPELESEEPPVALAEADELPSDDRPIQVESELDEVGEAPGPELESEDPPVALAEADELPSDDRPNQVESELDEVGEAPGPELESEDPPVALAEADELPSDDRPNQVESELDEVGEANGKNDDLEAHVAGLLSFELQPDPVTGLPGFPSVLGHLGTALGALAGSDNTVLFVVVDLAVGGAGQGTISDSVLAKVAGCLRDQVRLPDQVGRIGAAAFSIVVKMGTRSVEPSVFAARVGDALRAMTAAEPGGYTIRSAAACATSEHLMGPEDLLRLTTAQLGAP